MHVHNPLDPQHVVRLRVPSPVAHVGQLEASVHRCAPPEEDDDPDELLDDGGESDGMHVPSQQMRPEAVQSLHAPPPTPQKISLSPP